MANSPTMRPWRSMSILSWGIDSARRRGMQWLSIFGRCWRELLHREKRSLGVQVEHLVVDSLGDVLERRWDAEPTWRQTKTPKPCADLHNVDAGLGDLRTGRLGALGAAKCR